MTPFPNSARPFHSSKSSLVLFLSPSMPSKAGESQQSHKRSNSSSKAHQTFIMLPSSCNSCCWLYQEPELNRANSRSHTQAAVSAPSSVDVPVGAGEAVPAHLCAARGQRVRAAGPGGWRGGFVGHDAEHEMVLSIAAKRVTFAHWCILKCEANTRVDQARQGAPTDYSPFTLIPVFLLKRHKSSYIYVWGGLWFYLSSRAKSTLHSSNFGAEL